MTEPILHTILAELRALRREVAELREPSPTTAEADPVDRLRAACEARGIAVSVDDHVDELAAAGLFGMSRSGLKARRLESRCPVQHRRNLGRIEYPLAKIAEYLSRCEEIDL